MILREYGKYAILSYSLPTSGTYGRGVWSRMGKLELGQVILLHGKDRYDASRFKARIQRQTGYIFKFERKEDTLFVSRVK